ncbi:MAG TPA: response regulator [Humisphaera sp.]
MDDHADSADLLALLLRKCGLDAAVAYGGFEALSALRLSRPRVVVADYMMPDMTGADLVRRARAEGLLGGVRVVVYSGADDPARRADAAAAGVDAWFRKATDPDALLAFVRDLHGPS